jgi:hypothetical protein
VTDREISIKNRGCELGEVAFCWGRAQPREEALGKWPSLAEPIWLKGDHVLTSSTIRHRDCDRSILRSVKASKHPKTAALPRAQRAMQGQDHLRHGDCACEQRDDQASHDT